MTKRAYFPCFVPSWHPNQHRQLTYITINITCISYITIRITDILYSQSYPEMQINSFIHNHKPYKFIQVDISPNQSKHICPYETSPYNSLGRRRWRQRPRRRLRPRRLLRRKVWRPVRQSRPLRQHIWIDWPIIGCRRLIMHIGEEIACVGQDLS
jgi:hypothetical protein